MCKHTAYKSYSAHLSVTWVILKGMALQSLQEMSHQGPVLECQGKQQSIGVKKAKIRHQTLSL